MNSFVFCFVSSLIFFIFCFVSSLIFFIFLLRQFFNIFLLFLNPFLLTDLNHRKYNDVKGMKDKSLTSGNEINDNQIHCGEGAAAGESILSCMGLALGLKGSAHGLAIGISCTRVMNQRT